MLEMRRNQWHFRHIHQAHHPNAHPLLPEFSPSKSCLSRHFGWDLFSGMARRWLNWGWSWVEDTHFLKQNLLSLHWLPIGRCPKWTYGTPQKNYSEEQMLLDLLWFWTVESYLFLGRRLVVVAQCAASGREKWRFQELSFPRKDVVNLMMDRGSLLQVFRTKFHIKLAR